MSSSDLFLNQELVHQWFYTVHQYSQLSIIRGNVWGGGDNTKRRLKQSSQNTVQNGFNVNLFKKNEVQY
jgi:hypothetical protein